MFICCLLEGGNILCKIYIIPSTSHFHMLIIFTEILSVVAKYSQSRCFHLKPKYKCLRYFLSPSSPQQPRMNVYPGLVYIKKSETLITSTLLTLRNFHECINLKANKLLLGVLGKFRRGFSEGFRGRFIRCWRWFRKGIKLIRANCLWILPLKLHGSRDSDAICETINPVSRWKTPQIINCL
jgi:hypothetical protein